MWMVQDSETELEWKGQKEDASGKEKRNLDAADQTGGFPWTGIEAGSESGGGADHAQPWYGDRGGYAPVSVWNVG